MNHFPLSGDLRRWGEDNFKHSLKSTDTQGSQAGEATAAIFANLLNFKTNYSTSLSFQFLIY